MHYKNSNRSMCWLIEANVDLPRTDSQMIRYHLGNLPGLLGIVVWALLRSTRRQGWQPGVQVSPWQPSLPPSHRCADTASQSRTRVSCWTLILTWLSPLPTRSRLKKGEKIKNILILKSIFSYHLMAERILTKYFKKAKNDLNLLPSPPNFVIFTCC